MNSRRLGAWTDTWTQLWSDHNRQVAMPSQRTLALLALLAHYPRDVGLVVCGFYRKTVLIWDRPPPNTAYKATYVPPSLTSHGPGVGAFSTNTPASVLAGLFGLAKLISESTSSVNVFRAVEHATCQYQVDFLRGLKDLGLLVPKDGADPNYNAMFRHAVCYQQRLILQLVLSWGLPTCPRDEEGTCYEFRLVIRCSKGEERLGRKSRGLLDLLHSRGFKVNPPELKPREKRTSTPLHFAAGYGLQDVVTWILERGANVNGLDARDETALHDAIRSDSTCLQLLIDAGADIQNTGREQRLTPLHRAAVLFNAKCVRVLLNHGADPNAVDSRGRTPLAVAREHSPGGEAERILLDVTTTTRKKSRPMGG